MPRREAKNSTHIAVLMMTCRRNLSTPKFSEAGCFARYQTDQDCVCGSRKPMSHFPPSGYLASPRIGDCSACSDRCWQAVKQIGAVLANPKLKNAGTFLKKVLFQGRTGEKRGRLICSSSASTWGKSVYQGHIEGQVVREPVFCIQTCIEFWTCIHS